MNSKKGEPWGTTLGIGAVNLAKITEELKTPCERVLDVGCGLGFVVGNINARMKVGLDLFKEGFTPAHYADVSFIGGDANSLPLQDESFDFALCLDVLEHVENPEGVVGEIHRVLKGDGRAYFSTPVSGVRFLPRADDYTRLLHERWGHRRVYSREELIQLLEEGGFTVLRLSDYMHLTSRLFLYAYYMTVALAGRMDARAVRLSEKILYQASKLDSKIAFWSAFNTMAEAEKN